MGGCAGSRENFSFLAGQKLARTARKGTSSNCCNVRILEKTLLIMQTTLPYEYAVALRDSGYPQPEFAEGQTWYKLDTAMSSVLDADWLHRYRVYWSFRAKVNKSELAYAPTYEELKKATGASPKYNAEELANIWMIKNKKR